MGKRRFQGDPGLAVVYLRVSTDEQHLGPQVQTAAIEAWGVRERVRLLESFVETDVSGATPPLKRPAFREALDCLRQHGAGILVAHKRDRLARDVEVSALITREVARAGAVVRTADGTSDGAGSQGLMSKGMFDLFAAYEREVISERTAAALKVKKDRGERVGRVPFGYRAVLVPGLVTKRGVESSRIEPDPVEQEILAQVFSLRTEGFSTYAISAALTAQGRLTRSGKPWRQSQIFRLLVREKGR